MNRWSVLDAAGDYLIKATLGITGWYRLSVQSDGDVRHLDVGSTYPGGGEAPKGLAVRQLKSHASWVQTVEDLFFGIFPQQSESLITTQSNFSYMQKDRTNHITAVVCRNRDNFANLYR